MLEDFRLKVFMAVAETGSFTKASRKLGVSQPAVSQNISSLEKETGAILFQRARGEVSLTSEGLVFKEYASRIQYWYSATSEMFGQKGKLTSGKPVRICADSVAAAYLLPKPLTMITGSNPDIVFALTRHSFACKQVRKCGGSQRRRYRSDSQAVLDHRRNTHFQQICSMERLQFPADT